MEKILLVPSLALMADDGKLLSVAKALYETDEDIADEAVSGMIARRQRTSDLTSPRLGWEDISEELRAAYFRRAAAAIATIEYEAGLLSLAREL